MGPRGRELREMVPILGKVLPFPRGRVLPFPRGRVLPVARERVLPVPRERVFLLRSKVPVALKVEGKPTPSVPMFLENNK